MALVFSLFTLFASILVGLYRAYVVQLGWLWFIAPVFEIPTPPYWVLYGLLQVMALAQYTTPSVAETLAIEQATERMGKESFDLKRTAILFINTLLAAFVVTVGWGVLWIVHQMMG